MSTGSTKRKRSSLQLPPGQFARLWAYLQRGEVLWRLGLCALAAFIMWIVTGGWAPPFSYRVGYIPPRDIVASTEFSREDVQKTDERKRQLRAETLVVYQNDPHELVELRRALKDRAIQIARAVSFEALDKSVWSDFLGASTGIDEADSEQRFKDFRAAFADDPDLTTFEQGVQQAFQDMETNGLLENLQHGLGEGSQLAIMVHPVGSEKNQTRVEVKDVRIAEVAVGLEQRLKAEFTSVKISPEHVDTASQLVATWLKSKILPATLTLDKNATQLAYDQAFAQLEPVMRTFRPEGMLDNQAGDLLVKGGKPLTEDDIELLSREHRAYVAKMGIGHVVAHSLADLGMYVALFTLCGVYVFYHERRLLTDFRRFATMLGLIVVTVTLCKITSGSLWAELIPLTLFGMTVAIAYERELALLLASVVALIFALSFGQGLPMFVIMAAPVFAAVLLLGRIRSRTKLIYVGLGAGVVALLTTFGVGTLVGQPFGASKLTFLSQMSDVESLTHVTFAMRLLSGAVWFGFCSLLAGLIMTGLLPFIERMFDVQTDISLLELGDARHPLLQQLVQRAPGTYNHSINVASLSEAAAEAIGANGLLARVGAYFHDIGKMLKPQYFVENQGQNANRHESLVPAMSTLVIIAHVKDGADLARQHRLPKSIIAFIEQHHGTTLVEYFYVRAAEQSEADPDRGEVDEGSFRYPGPKPLTKEAGVMMLADAVESASRALVDPAPARIENLVEEIAMKRLLDDQFDECGLTLKELHTIQESLIKSLCAMYHGRVKYPEKQQTA